MSKRRIGVLSCVLSLTFGSACLHEGSAPTPPRDKAPVEGAAKPQAALAERPRAAAAEPERAREDDSRNAPASAYGDSQLGYDPTSSALRAAAPAAEHAGNRHSAPSKPKKEAAGSLGTLGVSGMSVGGGGSGYGRGAMAKSSAPLAQMAAPAEFNREAYAHIAENDFHKVGDEPLSTFSVDVDTASYSNVRRFLRNGQLPPADAVRIEELVNYFDYAYPRPENGEAFSTYAEVGACPWNPEHQLVHIGIAGKRIQEAQVSARNLVFLIDVSGSMMSPDKLPLLKEGMKLLVRNLRATDRVSVVVYAGSSGLVLPSTRGNQQANILDALDRLEAGGSTNGAEGIALAYREAQKNFIQGGINRVILATDGDFNVGVTSEGELTHLIEDKRKSGVFLTVLGFGSGNLQDSRMEQLADKGNGNYAYIDDLEEAQKVLVREAGATLVTIAKDVKLQVEFNPQAVESYRLVGYENRKLAARDFNDDKKDAGEIGAGHEVTALYEIVPRNHASASTPEVDTLRYQGTRPLAGASNGELLTVKVRYKAPNADQSKLIERHLTASASGTQNGSSMFRFSAAVAEFGMLLRNSPHKGAATLEQVRRLAESARAEDTHGERAQFIDMVQASERLGLGS
jgi:Ca-activated chloride channel family protein